MLTPNQPSGSFPGYGREHLYGLTLAVSGIIGFPWFVPNCLRVCWEMGSTVGRIETFLSSSPGKFQRPVPAQPRSRDLPEAQSTLAVDHPAEMQPSGSGLLHGKYFSSYLGQPDRVG